MSAGNRVQSETEGKVVVLGVTGGIAAFKAAALTSMMVKAGLEVHVVMTKAATEFVTPLTFRTLSQNPVSVELFSEPGHWNVKHVSLAQKADVMVIAPATANFIGKVASGIADDLLTTTVMATKAPVLIAPAMNSGMYSNPIVQANIEKLRGLGYRFIEPGYGRLACGDEGKGRMAEPDEILGAVLDVLRGKRDLEGLRVLLTAGPTREPLDPVRFISNRSSGKMGYAIAEAAKRRGAEVTLVSGPVHLAPPPGVEIVNVETACEMLAAVEGRFDQCDVLICTAAVADYRPSQYSDKKIKKTHEGLTIQLERNPDILLEMGRRKTKQVVVGFAAETGDPVPAAMDKLARKNCDLVVANDVTAEGAGFGADTNRVTLVGRDGLVDELPLMSKREVAEKVLDRVVSIIRSRTKDSR